MSALIFQESENYDYNSKVAKILPLRFLKGVPGIGVNKGGRVQPIWSSANLLQFRGIITTKLKSSYRFLQDKDFSKLRKHRQKLTTFTIMFT